MFVPSWVLYLLAYTLVSTEALIPILLKGMFVSFPDIISGKKTKSKLFEKEDVVLLVFLPGTIVLCAVLLAAAAVSIISETIHKKHLVKI